MAPIATAPIATAPTLPICRGDEHDLVISLPREVAIATIVGAIAVVIGPAVAICAWIGLTP